MVCALADIHGNVDIVKQELMDIYSKYNGEIVLFILGDAGFNFCMDDSDYRLKSSLHSFLEEQNAKRTYDSYIMFVRGNHDARPDGLKKYFSVNKYNGEVYCENEFPYFLFCRDGEEYEIGNEVFWVIGGGYSEDFKERLLLHWPYFPDEELSEHEFINIMDSYRDSDKANVHVLTHMMPYSYKKNINSAIIPRTEVYLQKILDLFEERISDWWCGHYHKQMDLYSNKGTPLHVCFHNIQIICNNK